MGSELVLSCVMPYIQQDIDVLNSVSLVSKNYYEIDSLTRKHLTVHVLFAPDPEHVSRRFPNIESLTLKSYSHGFFRTDKCCIPVTPWIHEIAVKFESLKSLSIRHMAVSPTDLQLLAKTRGASLRSLEISRCKMFSEDGLEDVARNCIDLRSLRLDWNAIGNDYIGGYGPNGKWLHELASHNTGVMESLDVAYPFRHYDEEDVALLAKKCSNSLVSINVFPFFLIAFKQVFKHAKKLEHFGIGIIDEDEDYSGFELPPNIRSLRVNYLHQASFPILLPFLHQLRELDVRSVSIVPECQCYFFERCPNLEVLDTGDICENIGCQLIGQFCKKLRKLRHRGEVTQLGLIAVAQGCPDLEYLDVSLLDISNEALECVGTHLKYIRDLRIDCEDSITDSPLDNGVRAILMGCSKLERLDFGLGFDGLTDVGLGIIGKYGHNLRSLDLRRTGESDVGLLELAKGCPKLRKLKLHDCPFSEQAIATHVFNINQSLRYIRVKSGPRDDLVLTRPMVFAEGDKNQRRRKKGEKVNHRTRPEWKNYW